MTIRRWSIGVLAVAGVLVATRRAVPSQSCREPHYRWSAKTDTSLADRPPQTATITDILTRWSTPRLGPRDRCAARAGRELDVYRVRGWIRRVEKVKDDGDWHLELTAGPSTPPESCVVVEIPLGDLGATYRRARQDLDALLTGRRLDRDGDLRAPIAVWVTGAPFFDGQHRRTTRKRDAPDGGHGSCNSSLRALWELHPVYAVASGHVTDD